MEIDKTKINKCNVIGQLHGYYEKYHDQQETRLWYKCHYFNSKSIGYDELYFAFDNKIKLRTHYVNNKSIGCEQHHNYQHFYNKSGKRFGEQVTWK